MCRNLASQPAISSNTNSDAAVDWFTRKLQNCVRNHKCGSRNTSVTLPDRVLDVGPFQNKSAGHKWDVKLFVSSNTSANYVCLSHCWGKLRKIVTTTKNIHSHVQGIPWQDLSKTFQDAIVFVRRTGLRYIWIDSLCIVQDSKEDWMNQSMQMAEIYRNAYITLAATKSSDGDGGLFTYGSPMDQDHPLMISLRESTSTVVTSTAEKQIFVRQKLTHFQREPEQYPLVNCGWVYQERFLLPRVVHFRHKELAWECQERVTCECAQPRSFEGAEDIRANAFNYWALADMPKDVGEDRTPITKMWHRLAEDYTRLSLSEPSDIWPTVGGLA
jgi:hypothetical protein